jgi:hypothetical protein
MRPIGAPLALVALLSSGCWSGGSSLRPGTDAHSVPAPTLMSRAVDCRDGIGDLAAGKPIVSQTDYGAAMIGAIDGRVLGFGPALPPFASSLCSELFASGALDDSDWSAPRPPPGVGKLLERYGARSMLVPAVGTSWQCRSEGELGTSCKETRVEVVAFLMTADAVIWKSRWLLAIGNETPDLDGGAVKLLESAPLRAIAELQDPEAPTYERALQQAGVEP